MLLWNYPGQAFSEWRDQQLLNNEYLSTILQYLLLHLGSKNNGGTGEASYSKCFTAGVLDRESHRIRQSVASPISFNSD